MTDGDIRRFCEVIKELRLGGMPMKLGSLITKHCFELIIIESIDLVSRIGWDNYKKYIDSWHLGVDVFSELTKEQLKIIIKELK